MGGGKKRLPRSRFKLQQKGFSQIYMYFCIMVKYAIIEDEPFARQEIERMMGDLRPGYTQQA